MTLRRSDILCVLVTLIGLSVGAANKLRLGSPPDAEPFLEQVRRSAAKSQGDVPGMIIQAGVMPRQAFELLRPNVLESRRYTDIGSGNTFTVLLVHCGDANDMGAHYPPACYPGSGLRVTENGPIPLEVKGLKLSGIEYLLEPSTHQERAPFYIWNAMFLPGGGSTYSPNDLRARTRTGNLRYYGAGQIQILVPASLPEDRRLAIYQDALLIYEPVIRTMLSDPASLPVRDRSVTPP